MDKSHIDKTKTKNAINAALGAFAEKNANKLKEALDFVTTDYANAVQARLYRAARIITDDALELRTQGILSPCETKTLRDAAGILHAMRAQMKHAGKAREQAEAQRLHILQARAEQSAAIVHEYFPRPAKADTEGYVNTLLWRLAMGDYFFSPANEGKAFYRGKFVDNANVCAHICKWHARTRNAASMSFHVSTKYWWQEFTIALRTELCEGGKEPDRAELEAMIDLFESEWRPRLTKNYSWMVEALENEMAIERSRFIVRLCDRSQSPSSSSTSNNQ